MAYRFFTKLCCAACLAVGLMTFSSPLQAQVLVLDTQMNGAIMEKNRLLGELLNENQTLSEYTSTMLATVGSYRNFAMADIRYPTELLIPSVVEQLGLGDYNATMLTTPLAIEAFLQNFVLLNPFDMQKLSDEEFKEKYKRTKDAMKEISKNRQLVLGREAIVEGYAIAYVARLKAAATGAFLQNELRERAKNSTSIREDLAIENLALAEIVGQLGALVAASASELEINASVAMLGIPF